MSETKPLASAAGSASDEIYRSELFRGKSVIVTGGGSGIGRRCAERFLRLGARVAICGRSVEKLARVRDAWLAEGLPVFAHRCDIRKVEEVSEFVSAVLAKVREQHSR
jgi:citronellol/citronellal dehydrogenase